MAASLSISPSPRSPHPSLLLITVITTTPSLSLKHLQAPNHPLHHPLISTARQALLSASSFIFPPSHTPSPPPTPPPSPPPTPPQPLISPLTSTPPSPSHSHLTRAIQSAKVLPLSQTAVYDALHEPASAPSSASLRLSAPFSHARPRRANSMPRRPDSSPPPRLRSLGLPAYTLIRHTRRRNLSSVDQKGSTNHPWQDVDRRRRRWFCRTLCEAKTHAFAITDKDGARQYVYCRPLSNGLALVLMSTVSYTAVYVSALENAAARYARRVEEGGGMRCEGKVGRALTRGVWEWLKGGGHAEEEVGDATWLTSSTTSSGLSVTEDKVKKRESSGILGTRRAQSELPWEAVAGSDRVEESVLRRVLELTDATVLFRHLPVKSIVSLVVALLEERRVCLVGRDTAVVSRAVLAVDNLLRPFEWPHLLSPILLEHMLPVLGAPFPFLVGILSEHMEQTAELPLDEVVFVDLESGKVTMSQGSGDLYKRVPRKIRAKFEKRLSRTKSACSRQITRSMSSPYVPAVSNTATSYFEDDPFQLKLERPKSTGSLLWRSKSQQRLQNEASSQNIWLEHGTVASLDKCMRKFYAELLEDLPSLRNNDDANESTPSPVETAFKFAGSTVAGSPFASSRRDSDRSQLARSFIETQMFMQWEKSDKCDPTFGISLSEQSILRRPGSVFDLTKKKQAESETKTGTDYELQGMSDLECYEELDANKDLNVPIVAEITPRPSRVRGRRKNRRGESRLQFNSEVEEFPEDPRIFLSDTEGSAWATDAGLKPRSRNANADCSADTEVETGSRRPWLSLRLPQHRWAGTKDLSAFWSPSVKPDETSVNETPDQPFVHVTEAEDSCHTDMESDDGFVDKSEHLLGTEHTFFAKSRKRAWGRRRVRQSSRVY